MLKSVFSEIWVRTWIFAVSPLKKQASDWLTIWSTNYMAVFSRKPIELMSWMGSQKKLTLVCTFKIHTWYYYIMKIQHSHQIVKFFVQLMRNLFRCRLTGLRSCWRAHFQSKSSHYGAKNWRNSDGRARVTGAPNLCSFHARFAFG